MLLVQLLKCSKQHHQQHNSSFWNAAQDHQGQSGPAGAATWHLSVPHRQAGHRQLLYGISSGDLIALALKTRLTSPHFCRQTDTNLTSCLLLQLQAGPIDDVTVICESNQAFWAQDRDAICSCPRQLAAFRQQVQEFDEQTGQLRRLWRLKPAMTTGFRNLDKDGGHTVRLLAHGGLTSPRPGSE